MDGKKKGLTFVDILGALKLFFVIALPFAGIGLLFIPKYQEYDMDYSDFTYEELTYVGYTKEKEGKAYDSSYSIYFKEYDVPFTIDGISKEKLNTAALKMLKENEPVQVYYYLNQYSKYEISEISTDKGVLLSLSGFVEENQKNQKVGMVGFPIIGAVFGLMMAVANLGTRSQKILEGGDHEPVEEKAE